MRPLIFILVIIVSITATANTPSAIDKFVTDMNTKIVKAEALEEFWYGDDGEDCGEPQFTIENIDLKNKTMALEVYQTEEKHECSSLAFQCKLTYKADQEGKVVFNKVDPVDDQHPLVSVLIFLVSSYTTG